MINSSNLVPAFGGVINTKPVSTIKIDIGMKSVVDQTFLKIFVKDSKEHTLPKFYVSENRFLWSGGLDLGYDFHLEKFDSYKADHKFVFISFSKNELALKTDHYSKIPLLYYQKGDALYFSTSLCLLMTMIGKDKMDVDNNGLLFYYNFGFTSFNNYLLQGVKSVSGGKQITYFNGTTKIENYFDLLTINKYSSNSLNNNIQLVDKYLLESTEATLSSNNNIGIALSGGVDSGYLAQKIHECGKSFNAYTIGFKNDYNEFERIDYLSGKLNFSANKIILTPEQIISNYLEVSQYSSFPVGFNNSILNFIYKEAKEDGVNIMFDGDGADRLFLGMNKYVQLQKILNLYNSTKRVGVQKLFTALLKIVRHPAASKLRFYFTKFNQGYPFYGERKLHNQIEFDSEFEILLNDLALPLELKNVTEKVDSWLFFSFFSVYYTPTFFFHTPYELQIKHDIVSNPQFWSDDLVALALQIPVEQKLKGLTTKLVLREAAKLKIDDGYWNLSKIGLQNSYSYLKNSKEGQAFVNEQTNRVIKTEEYQTLKELMPKSTRIDTERLIPYTIWKDQY